jgi:hypothetical protein
MSMQRCVQSSQLQDYCVCCIPLHVWYRNLWIKMSASVVSIFLSSTGSGWHLMRTMSNNLQCASRKEHWFPPPPQKIQVRIFMFPPIKMAGGIQCCPLSISFRHSVIIGFRSLSLQRLNSFNSIWYMNLTIMQVKFDFGHGPMMFWELSLLKKF